MTFSLFQEAIIAPLWTNLIITESSRIYYRVSKNSSDLDIIAGMIANATSDDSYYPILAIIVTWENVSMFVNRSLTVSEI